MKTTLEMPDDLMRRIKIRAAHRNEKLKDTVARLLEAGMAVESADAPRARPPRPVKLKQRGPVTIDDIESAIAAGRA
jgi:plasmid stability protein